MRVTCPFQRNCDLLDKEAAIHCLDFYNYFTMNKSKYQHSTQNKTVIHRKALYISLNGSRSYFLKVFFVILTKSLCNANYCQAIIQYSTWMIFFSLGLLAARQNKKDLKAAAAAVVPHTHAVITIAYYIGCVI